MRALEKISNFLYAHAQPIDIDNIYHKSRYMLDQNIKNVWMYEYMFEIV